MSKAYSKNQVGFGGPSSRPPPFCTLEGFPLLTGPGPRDGPGAEGSGPRDDPGAEGPGADPGAEGSGAEDSVLLAGPGAEGPGPRDGPGARAGDGEFDLTGIPVKLLKEFIKL